MTDTNTLAPTDQSRAEFDTWFNAHHGLHPDTNTTFRSDALEPWKAWQAARRAPTPQQISDYIRGLDAINRAVVEREAQPVVLPAGLEPFGIWHEGETEDESDFYLFKDSGDVSCDKCVKLYTASQVQAMLAAGLAPGWQAVPVEPTQEMIENTAAFGSDDLGVVFRAMLAAAPSGPAREPLTSAQMAAGRESIFSTSNPYCPCDSKTFRKVAEWVERYHGITAAPKPVRD